MNETESITIVVTQQLSGPPSVACSVAAHVMIADEQGYTYAEFPAQDVFSLAAFAMKSEKPKDSP